MWSLTIRTSHQKVVEYHPKAGITKIGRTPDCEITLRDEAVSRHHAEIQYDPRKKLLTIRDLDSTNGTFVNGRKIITRVQLEQNDQIRIGQSLIGINLADTHMLDQQENIVTLSKELSKALLIESIENFGVLLNDLSLQLINVSDKLEALKEISEYIEAMIAATKCQIILAEDFDHMKGKNEFPFPILLRVIEERTPMLISNIIADKILMEGVSGSKASAIIVLPIIIGPDLAGIIYAEQEGIVEKAFDRNDLQLVMAVSHQIALTLLRFEHQKELIHHANHDPLTNLPNRTRLLDRLEQAIARSKREEDFNFALFFLDIDDFKVVNDSLGHIIGDKILQNIGKRLTERFREVDTIARIGGDEFVILYEGLDDLDHTLNIAERLIDCFKQPYVIEGRDIFIAVSVGGTTSLMEYNNPEEILRDSDIAMYRAKDAGGSKFQLFDSEMHKELVDLLELQTSVQMAVHKEELILHYQPVISLLSGQIVGFEALVRWNSPEKGILGPDRFLLHLDTTGLLNEIDLWVLSKAIEDFSELHKNYPEIPPHYVSVNISERTFFNYQLSSYIDHITGEAGFDQNNLVFEITERANIKVDETILQIMNQLRSKGIKLSLDDFGTGYSTLGYLHRFPVDFLKIDKSFVQTVGMGGENARIVETIVSLADHIRMNVVAEGVETEEQFEFLRGIHCAFAQGYYFSHPIDIHSVQELLNSKPSWKKWD